MYVCMGVNNNNKFSPYFNPTYTRTGWIGQPPVLDRHEVVVVVVLLYGCRVPAPRALPLPALTIRPNSVEIARCGNVKAANLHA